MTIEKLNNMTKPPLIEMMKSLYYLYSIGLIQWPLIEFNLEQAYNVHKVYLIDNKMIAYEYSNYQRGRTITTISI